MNGHAGHGGRAGHEDRESQGGYKGREGQKDQVRSPNQEVLGQQGQDLSWRINR